MSTHTLSPKHSNESMQSMASAISFPDKLAPAVVGPMVWENIGPAEYVVELTPQEVRDIRAAVIKFKIAGLERPEISQDTFDLGNPELAIKLSSVSAELHHGRGVVVLRGLDAANFNDEEAVIAFVGLCSYVCPERATDSYANQTLSHVHDVTKETVPFYAQHLGLAGSKLPDKMDFHSDRFSGDVLALHVRNEGAEVGGGEQSLASFWRIYNELLEKDPEVLETMTEPSWPFELKQKDSDPYLLIEPTLFFSKGKPICQLVKAPLLGTPQLPRQDDMPKLSGKQLHAIKTIEELAKRFATQIDRKQGDVQFFNNLSMLHARASYASKEGEPVSTRHLLRMFLRDPANAWDKPAAFRKQFDDPFTPGRLQEIPVRDDDPRRKISGRESHG